MDPLDALAILLLLGAVLLLTRPLSMAQGMLDSLGAGFLPYRADDGWPRHVQEEGPTAWSWRARDAPDIDVGVPTQLEPEIIDAEVAAGSGATLERVSLARLHWIR